MIDGVVSVAGDASKKISYGQLIGGKKFNTKISASGTGWDMKVAPEVKAKDPKQYKIVGQSVKRVELPAKVTGEHDYIHDVRIPGMLHGRVVRPPVINTEPVSIDQDSIKGHSRRRHDRARGKIRRRRRQNRMGRDQSGASSESHLVETDE